MERSSENVSYLQTAGRALEILMMFQNENVLSLMSIAKRMNVSTTVAYRLVYTLTTEGFLYQDPETKQYLLGDKVMMLGFCTVHRQDVKRIARDLLWDFFEQTGYSITMTMPCAQQSLCIDRIVSSTTGRATTMFLGGLYPLDKGASNRVLLAFMPEEERESYLQSRNLPAEEERVLREHLEVARRRGYDFTKSDMPGGLFAVGFPIYNSYNRLVAGLSVGGAVSDISEEMVEKMTGETRLLAMRINNRMGATCVPY